ncbi:hypothetical protein B7C42_06803 [Nocardia cerradoensis]|uniref:Secreted protein n=1 Tax=Nocardia cerradoensis TaxID=85688 RepID=A0A231GWP6_9NOCA|nr:hypothetical protein [Nocardia cerradoensis]OXR41033.1 hypothetical protein B7C42_06803 [Nocardia cerradoensis]
MLISRVLHTAAATLAITAGLAAGVAAAAPLPLEPVAPVAGTSGSADSATDGGAGSSVIDLLKLLGDISHGCTPGTVCAAAAATARTPEANTAIADTPLGSGSASGSNEPGSVLCWLLHPSPTCQI